MLCGRCMNTQRIERSESGLIEVTKNLPVESVQETSATLVYESKELFNRSQYVLALPYTLALLESSKKENNLPAYLETFCQLVSIYEQAGIFPTYMESLATAIQIISTSGPSLSVAKTHIALGRLYHLLGDYDQALIYFTKSYEMQQFLNQPEANNLVYRMMAEAYSARDDWDLALDCIQKGLAAHPPNSDPLEVAASLNTFAEILSYRSQWTAALRKYTLALQSAHTAGNPYERVRSLIGLAETHAKLNRHDQVLTLWQQAYTTARKHQMHALLAKITLELANRYKANQSFKLAADYFEMYIDEHRLLSLQSFATELRNLETAQKIEIINRRNHQLRHEIQERMKNQAELEMLATTDSLTGLFNRRHFFTLTEHWCENAPEIVKDISAMMIDIDHFKRINDTYGHPAGDQVLIQVAQTIQNTLRTDDILSRYGGEEFCLLLPNTNLAAAQQVAERIRQKIQELQIHFEGHIIQLTVSIGVADLANSPKHSVMGLLGHADQALYKAKHKGRNRCAIFSA